MNNFEKKSNSFFKGFLKSPITGQGFDRDSNSEDKRASSVIKLYNNRASNCILNRKNAISS